MSCDLYNQPNTVSTNTESIDHTYDGFKNIGHTGEYVQSISMWLYRTEDDPADLEITMYHFEGTTQTNTFSPSGNVKYTELTTSSSGQLVTWTLNGILLTDNTVFVIPNSVNGDGKGRALSFTPVDFNDFSTVKNIPAVAVGWSFCGCITSGEAPSPGGGNRLPPPPLIARF